MEVFPDGAVCEMGNGPLTNTEVASHLTLTQPTSQQRQRLSRRLVGEFGVAVVRPARLIPALLREAIAHVVLLRAEKQVGRITAARVIAAVADVQGRIYRAVSQLIGDAVGVDLSQSFRGGAANAAVTEPARTACPRPAFVRCALADAAPQSFCKRNYLRTSHSEGILSW